MVKVVIFDFDLTLFDSTLIKSYMDNRQWSQVYKNIPFCDFYPAAIDLLNILKTKNIKTAIVSNSPSLYVKKVLSFYNVHIDFLVCYHDVTRHKPSPEGIYKVLHHFSISNDEVIYIGDNDLDYYSALNANIRFFGVPWGDFSQRTKYIHYSSIYPTIFDGL